MKIILRTIECALILLVGLPHVSLNSVYAKDLTVEKPSRAQHTHVVGWVERVSVLEAELELEAKIAPAVELSSLHAENVEEFEKEDQIFVRFRIEDRHGESRQVEFPLSNIKKTRTAKGNRHVKRVIKLPVCLAGMRIDAEVLLSDRSSLEQELRLGRNVLAGNFLVDPARTHISKPKCKS